MFDIGFFELLLIGIVTLVVVGPERLPEVAKTAGVYVAKFRRFVAGVRSDIDKELESGELKKLLGDQRDQIKELKDIVDTTRREIETSTSSAMKSANEFSSSMESKFTSLGNEAKGEEKAEANPEAKADESPESNKTSDNSEIEAVAVPAKKSETKAATQAAAQAEADFDDPGAVADSSDIPDTPSDQSSGNAKTG